MGRPPRSPSERISCYIPPSIRSNFIKILLKYCRDALLVINRAISNRTNRLLHRTWECIRWHFLEIVRIGFAKRQQKTCIAMHVTSQLLHNWKFRFLRLNSVQRFQMRITVQMTKIQLFHQFGKLMMKYLLTLRQLIELSHNTGYLSIVLCWKTVPIWRSSIRAM